MYWKGGKRNKESGETSWAKDMVWMKHSGRNQDAMLEKKKQVSYCWLMTWKDDVGELNN